MDLIKKLSIMVVVVCILIALRNHRALNELHSDPLIWRNLWEEPSFDGGELKSLNYDFYATSCPSAQNIIRSTVRELHRKNSAVGPQLVRLAFHDCFIGGCDASVLLDGVDSEKKEIPNLSLKGFEEIDVIKSRVEEECPAVVSCADIVALAARESVLMAGGQFYPVFTGRRDSMTAFSEEVRELPGPDFVVAKALEFFAAKGFDARDTVALLGGGHSAGKVHCNFFFKRLFNFSESTEADPSIDPEFLEVLRSQCSHRSSSSSASFENRAMQMDYEGPGKGFGEVYFRSLLRGKGLLFVDQQLLGDEETKSWVESYASDLPQFRRDFGLAMIFIYS